MSEVKTKALDNKLPEKLADVKVETLVTLLSERKAEALMDTPVARLTDVKIETLGVTVAQRHAKALISQWAHTLATVQAKA